MYFMLSCDVYMSFSAKKFNIYFHFASFGKGLCV